MLSRRVFPTPQKHKALSETSCLELSFLGESDRKRCFRTSQVPSPTGEPLAFAEPWHSLSNCCHTFAEETEAGLY